MKARRILTFFLAVCCILTVTACKKGATSETCNHVWVDATCSSPKTCTLCSQTEGTARSHSWTEATCTTGSVCSLCGVAGASALGHHGGYADCTTKAICEDCGEEYGDFDDSVHTGNVVWFKHKDDHSKGYDCCGKVTQAPEQHVKVGGVCSICGFDPTFSCSEAEISADGNTAIVYISVSDNPGIVGLELNVAFEEGIVLIDAENCSALGALALTKPTDFSRGGTFVWDGVGMEDKDVRNGEVLKLTFDISNASAGDWGIVITVRSACDNNLQQLAFKVENGKIVITE